MYFLFSGEGAWDFGICTNQQPECSGAEYGYGPMAVIVDQIVKSAHDYSILEYGLCHFIARTGLSAIIKASNPIQPVRLPGKKRPKEALAYFRSAVALAKRAKALAKEKQDTVVAILFCDSDGTVSSDRQIWDFKIEALTLGFLSEEFETGVPMVPKPKSEAWLICALKENPYVACNNLENRSGNDKSPNSLKGELEEIVGAMPSREELCELFSSRQINIDNIDMHSFNAFRTRLKEVI